MDTVEKYSKKNEYVDKYFKQYGNNIEQLKNDNIKKDKIIKELEKKLTISKESKIDRTPLIFNDKNNKKHCAYAAKISKYFDKHKTIVILLQDNSYIYEYTSEKLRDNLEKKHPGETICNNFTRYRCGISIDGSSSLYMNPMCNKYKDSMDEYICYYCYSDNEEQNEKFKKNNPVGTHIILNVVEN
tara:strand:+ start:169 stop:726 length:558 start_codon:yes stop_codon:yes gene_type:complete